MTREQSWEATGVTLSILRQASSLGYTVSVFRFRSSALGRPGFVEMHAVELAADPPVNHVSPRPARRAKRRRLQLRVRAGGPRRH